MPDEASVVYSTMRDEEEARKIGRTLVELRLVACVNILGRIGSLYWWEGKISEESEALLIAKTKTSLVPAVIEQVKAMHSYSCPCVVALPITAGNGDYLAWILRETR